MLVQVKRNGIHNIIRIAIVLHPALLKYITLQPRSPSRLKVLSFYDFHNEYFSFPRCPDLLPSDLKLIGSSPFERILAFRTSNGINFILLSHGH